NKLTTLPDSFWRLKKLERLELRDNRWKGAWKGIEEDTTPRVLELCRQRAPIIAFISNSKGDETKYRVNDLKEKLKRQEEIREIRVSGEHDISESHLVLFIATKKSMNDEQCRHELELAKTHDIGIIPIKGTDISFEDLDKIDLGEDYSMGDKLGLAFNDAKFRQFCDELYGHIKKYKREVNLFEPGERMLETRWANFKALSEKYIESEEFREKYLEQFDEFNRLLDDLKSEQITPIDYIIRWSQILKSGSKSS
ncbi:MAG: hypothetical protein ACFE8P_16920, partial [Promethearchaeota archaeon]